MRILPDNINPDRYLGKGTELIYLSILFTIIVIVSLAGIHFLTDVELTAIGSLGSFLGGILGPLFALLVGVFTFLAFYVQFVANKEIQEQFKIQQFENQFYKMLDLHKANVDELKIPYFDIFRKNITNEERLRLRNGKIESHIEQEIDSFLRHVEGRKAFVDMVEEFHSILKAIFKEPKFTKYSAEEKLDFSYKIFFWGLYSNFSTSNFIDKSDQKILKTLLKCQQKDYKSALDSGNKPKIRIKFIPYQGHESHLAHYYRHLFQTVKYVVRTEKSGVITYEQARQYLRILRAQLSNAEQQMLYYNYICGFGKEWDKLGKKKNQFFTRYRMIHNIPVDRVKYVENPRDHFKDFICDHCSEDDPLYEWGDEREELGCT